jgi:hypothetical protein
MSVAWPLVAAERLVDHDAAVREPAPHALAAGGEEQGRHGRGLAEAHRGHGAAHVLHGVVDREAGGDEPPGLLM